MRKTAGIRQTSGRPRRTWICRGVIGPGGLAGEAQQVGDAAVEGVASLGGVAEMSGCGRSVAEHHVAAGGEVGPWVAGGGERVADEVMEPGAVGEDGAHDRAVRVF